MIRVRGMRLALSLLVLTLGATVPAAATSAQHAKNFRFPLWKDVPGHSFAVLAHRTTGKAEWAAFASRGASSAKSRYQPCITVAIFTRDNRYANAGSCGPPAPELGLRHPPIHPLIGESLGSYFAISVTRKVVRMDLELQSGVHISPHVHRLSGRQAQKTHLVAFNSVAQSFPRDTCIRTIKGYAADGTIILEADTDEC
jgi:hypothetical protein